MHSRHNYDDLLLLKVSGISSVLVWTVSNQKGGVGKTTTAVALGGLAADAGKKVLLIDLDPQGSLSSWFRQDSGVEGESVYSLFESKSDKGFSREFVHSLILGTEFTNINLIKASTLLATLERQSVGQGKGLILSKALAAIYEDFDLVLLDCPPQLGILMVNALAACQKLIVPVQTEFLAIKGLERILNTINMMSRSRHNQLDYLIVPTMFDRRTQASVSSLRTIRHQFGESVWPGMIRVDTRLRDASKAGIPPHQFDPLSRAAEDYHSLFKFLGRANVLESRAAGS